MNSLDPQVKTLWAFGTFFRYIILSVVVFVTEYFIIKPNFEWFLPIGVIGVALLIFTILMTIFYPILNYKYWKFEVRDEELYLERGIITRVKTTAPYSRIQHLDVDQNFFERMMHLSSLVIYTAGTRGADITIPGLPEDYAEQLRDRLKDYTPEDAV